MITPGCVRQRLRHHLLTPERDDDDRADIGMAAVGRERVVGYAHVRTELSTPGEVRQGHTERRRGRRDALGDDRRADHRRDDEDVVARSDAAIGAAESAEAVG